MSDDTFSSICVDLLGRGESIRFRAEGSSMEPAIKDGELLTVEPRPAELVSKGEIVLYESAGRLTAHRLLGRDRQRGELICQGDNWYCRREIVPESRVLGVVTAVGENGEKPLPRRRLSVWVRAIARIPRSFGGKIYRTIYGNFTNRHATISSGVGTWSGLAKGERKS